jgi:hypothetical protein
MSFGDLGPRWSSASRVIKWPIKPTAPEKFDERQFIAFTRLATCDDAQNMKFFLFQLLLLASTNASKADVETAQLSKDGCWL